MCMIDYSDGNDWYADSWPKARKSHKCIDCGRAIEVGERYLRAACGGDGSVTTQIQCAHCNGAAELLQKYCHGFVFGSVQEDLEEHIGGYPWSMDAARRVVGMRRRWKRFRNAGLMPVPSAA